jgi:hypothetical protein
MSSLGIRLIGDWDLGEEEKTSNPNASDTLLRFRTLGPPLRLAIVILKG